MEIEHYYVYTLYSEKDNKLYTGYSTNLKQRLKAHFEETVTSTRYRRPLKLIQYECYINKQDAKAREVFLKSGFGRKQLRKALQKTLSVLSVPLEGTSKIHHILCPQFERAPKATP